MTAFARGVRLAITKDGDAVSYHGRSGTVNTYAVIQRQLGLMISGVELGEDRWIATLILADVGAPARGDTITEADGSTWVVQEQTQPSSKWSQTWTVTQQ